MAMATCSRLRSPLMGASSLTQALWQPLSDSTCKLLSASLLLVSINHLPLQELLASIARYPVTRVLQCPARLPGNALYRQPSGPRIENQLHHHHSILLAPGRGLCPALQAVFERHWIAQG